MYQSPETNLVNLSLSPWTLNLTQLTCSHHLKLTRLTRPTYLKLSDVTRPSYLEISQVIHRSYLNLTQLTCSRHLKLTQLTCPSSETNSLTHLSYLKLTRLTPPSYLWVVLEHELVSGQEVFFGEQLHVLADVFHKLNGISLLERNRSCFWSLV